ncbi:helix-turn-helix transcriptional regulator [Lactobacillus sp. ESL0791]|uniref:helix-turn-helix domain-containing protein n=1 Tax=Lactobacillus sp. ESL0791 TaxID=2983234 RepID=UPI0023F78036|nr:helix-turn-helix transcriptional regulator [Lactobacillus sp. ESL0791]MDF7637962.1 helix-turn-helix transcriptional regulator [Lactobacillus sp. ESL0791]
MKHIGENIKDIRLSRKLKQTDLADHLFTRTAISKIEHNSQKPSYEDCIQLITRLGVSPTEFEYIRNNYSFTPKQEIIYCFINVAYSTQTTIINKLLEKCSLLDRDPDIARIEKILLAFKTGKEQIGLTKAKKIIMPLWHDYYSKIDTWTILDLYTLNMIFFIFDNETMNQISNKAIKMIETDYPFLKSLETSFLLNKAIIFIRAKDFTEALAALNKALPLCNETLRYDKLAITKFRIAICNKDKKEALHYLKVLEEMGATELVENFALELKMFDYLFA